MENSDSHGRSLAHLQRFVPAGIRCAKKILGESAKFAVWAAHRRYNALVLPLALFASGSRRQFEELDKNAAKHGIAVEAGGRELSALVPRGHFLLHRDFFRMEEGRRKKDHHFCPTNPGTIALIGKEGGRLFKAAVGIAGIQTFHLWPDKGAEAAWCSCPSCRAFSAGEQNRMGVNAAADILAAISPKAVITFFEKSGEGGKIPLRKNLVMLERLPDEKEYPRGPADAGD